MRVGIGHRRGAFDPGTPLLLGGLKVEGAWGLKAAGDGDVALLALADALLGAAGLEPAVGRDDAPAAVVLAESRVKVRARGWRVANVDVSLLAARPDLTPHLGAMRARIAELLDLPDDAVGVKPTDPGGMEEPDGEGIRAWAVALLRAADAEDDA